MTPILRAQKKSPAKSKAAGDRNTWVEATLRKMTLREKLGQLLMIHYWGVYTSANDPDYKELVRLVEQDHIGGLILGTERGVLGIERSQIYPTAITLNDLQKRSEVPLLVGADFEAGTGMRLTGGTYFPAAMAVAAAGDPKLAYEEGKIVALESRAAGIQWIFAPDADVNNNPDNPIINTRSFGEDPQSVAQYVVQFVRGVQDNGAIATVKHFPGHGNVSTDSHLSLAVVTGSRDELNSVELVPFRAAIDAGVQSVMPGHLAVPALEPDASIPATISPAILTGLLRDQMKFRGLIVTDALDMGGVTSMLSPGEAAVRAVLAGADVLLMPPYPDAALEGLEDAVNSGRLPVARVDESVRRILAAKARVGLDKNRFVDVTHLNETIGTSANEDAAEKIAAQGVTVLRNSQNLLPLDAAKPLRVLLVSLSADPDAYPGAALEPEIRWRVDSLTALRADTSFSPVSNLKLPPPETYDVAIAALFVRVADRKGNVAFPPEQRAFVNQMLTAGKPVIVAAFGSPYLISLFPNVKTWVAEFSTNPVSQTAVASAIFGQTPIGGKIPVTVPGVLERGDGINIAANPMTLQPASAAMSDRLKPVYTLLNKAVTDGAFPGGVLGVGWHGQLIVHPFGKLENESPAYDVDKNSIYDMASLTKAMVTTTAVMMLVQDKRLDLDAPVSRYLPEFGAAAKTDPHPAWRARVTVRMLLLHDSGLPGIRRYYLEGVKGHDQVLARAMAEPLVHEPGTQVEYSDLGFMMLGEIVERLTGQTLDQFAQQKIFQPLGMNRTMFRPPKSLRPDIAPTEYDGVYRKRMIWGEVHDENAWAMGGVAGQAGLFSTAPDVAVFAQMLLNGGIYGHVRILDRSTIQQFTARVNIGDSARTLGWDVITSPEHTGKYFSPAAYGHYGFTGTSLWIDPQNDLFIILLTNRVHPTRANEQIRQVRPAVHNAVFEALGLAGSKPGAR
ncbi:MAG TPA: glycoside hydrolase family 3 N-terminal domain-containing protein [Candidatus Acidoferrum sp.]|nr:glycoside hydrolase family 3 N-terminal domain-containing protein [Candidatus Acidoferrum sp.]